MEIFICIVVTQLSLFDCQNRSPVVWGANEYLEFNIETANEKMKKMRKKKREKKKKIFFFFF